MKRWFSTFLQFLLLLALSSCGASSKTSRLPDQSVVKTLLVQLVDKEKRGTGMVIGMIADDPQERWVLGYGKLSTTDERVPDGDTVFEIGSITKVFTGTLLAQAVLNGEVKLDDPISMYLPEGITAPEYEGRSITLLDLATHTAGWAKWPGNLNANSLDDIANYDIDRMYDFVSSYHLTRAPGSSFEYSNFGFGLLGNLLVRRAGQKDYEALLVERITRPLGMNSTCITLTPEMRSRLAAPYDDLLLPSRSWEAPALDGGGSIRSTANDMLTFLAANMGINQTELQPALRLANTPQRPTNGAEYIGLGWVLPKSGNGIHWHNGETVGYHSYLGWDPQRKIGVVVLTNATISIDDLGSQLVRGLPLTPVSVDPQVLAAYAGRYQFPNEHFVTIRVDGTRIFLQAPNQPEYELYARSENQFYPREFEAEITFYRNDKGEVDRITLLQSGDTYEARKVP